MAAILLQKSKDAKRIYATVAYTKVNCDGFKDNGIICPKRDLQQRLMNEFYLDCEINPNKISYLEANAVGSALGDSEECAAIDAALCSNRTKSLLVGSIKSNMGHAEPAAGIASITKIILALERKIVPANINFTTENKNIPALLAGRLKVCTKNTELTGLNVAVNSFGLSGVNVHALLCGNEKEMNNCSMPKIKIPRLIFWSGRTEESIHSIFDYIETSSVNDEFIALLHNIQKVEEPRNIYRGFGVFEQLQNENAKCIQKNIQQWNSKRHPIVWTFSGMGSQWPKMGTSLMEIVLFKNRMKYLHDILQPLGVNLLMILTTIDNDIFKNVLNAFVGITAVQIGLIDILKYLNIDFDFLIGHSLGELGCGYADGCLSAKETILLSYARGFVTINNKFIFGSMAAVGLSYENIKETLPPGVYAACHNGPSSCTISGPANEVQDYINILKNKNIFAKEVACGNIAFHTKYIAEIQSKLFTMSKDILPGLKERSSKWLSTSVPQNQWNDKENVTNKSSPEYYTNNMMNPVLFEEASSFLPKNAVIIEIAPHGLLQAILKKSFKDATNISLTQRDHPNNISFFLAALGKYVLFCSI